MKNEKTFTGLYFGVIPDLKDLAGYLIEEHGGLNNIQPLGCRVLLSPCLENGNQAFVISKKSVLKCSKFQDLMQKLDFKIVQEVDISKQLFEYCLAFTLNQKLAPLWNKAGEYLIQEQSGNASESDSVHDRSICTIPVFLYFCTGRNFVQDASKLNAIIFDVGIADRLSIGLKAFNIKMNLCQPSHFCSSSNVLQSFLTQKDATIGCGSIHNDLCFVLPSLKKARVVGISHQIPSDCPFECYEDLRKHWKLMYGYRLPANETTFYSVKFFFSKSKIFTYPSSCIRSAAPQVSTRCDQQAIFQAFIQDIQSRMPYICESPLRVTSSPLYCSNTLHSAADDHQSSVTRVPPMLKHCTPYVQSSTKPSQASADSAEPNGINRYAAIEQDNHMSQSLQDLSNTSFLKPDIPRFVPNFTKSTSTFSKSRNAAGHKSTLEHLSSICETRAIRPVFQTKPNLSKKAGVSSLSNRAAYLNGAAPQAMPSPLLGRDPTPSSSVLTSQYMPYVQNTQHAHTKTLPETRPGLVLVRSTQKNAVTASGASLIRDTTSGQMGPGQNLTGTLYPSNETRSGLIKPVHQTNGILTSKVSRTFQEVTFNVKGNLQGVSKKRQNNIADNAAQIKKPRMKPKVQEDIDVRQLAMANQLNEVNSVTLIDWLKKRKIAVKQKDKKVELIEKVMNLIRSNAE